jgi:site-specific DNA-methyltransferase (adenine-specific)
VEQPLARAPRNRTVTLSDRDSASLDKELVFLDHSSEPLPVQSIENKILVGDSLPAIPRLPHAFADLLFVDPPYNLDKLFGARPFRQVSDEAYARWFEEWFELLLPTLKPSASVYVCADWRSTGVVQAVLGKHLLIRNRITWEREKGRGAKTNWKNCAEDIWFATVSHQYTFRVEAVKVRRPVIAPYRHPDGRPKDWQVGPGGPFRDTHPSNLWTDLTVPFWSMPENTPHPAQKPEKLLAKVILASSNPGDLVLDPFLGSGTTAAVAKKLGRRYVGIEIDPVYCRLAQKRVMLAETDQAIQGYHDGVFWERNTR